jgi:hypothetical protein
MTIHRRLLAGSLGLAVAVAACGGSSTASPGAAGSETAAPTEAPAATAAPTEAATTEPAATEAATDGGGGVPGALNDLAATLPAEAAGVTYERAGFDGAQLGMLGAAAGIDLGELDPILKANGKTLRDVNFAVGTSKEASGGMIYAIQIQGVDASTFAGAMGMDTGTTPSSIMGGKTVYGQSGGGMGAYAYVNGDTMYLVLMASPQVTEAVFQQLP